MGSTLRVTKLDNRSHTVWMPTSGVFDYLLSEIAKKIETDQPVLAAEMKAATDSFPYFDLTSLLQEPFSRVAEAAAEVYRETLTGKHDIFLSDLTELVVLLSFDPRCQLTIFPDYGVIHIDNELQWKASGWIYAMVMAGLIDTAEHKQHSDLATHFLNSLLDQSYRCDLSAFGTQGQQDMSRIINWLNMRYAIQTRKLEKFEHELRPAALALAEMYLAKYPYHEPDTDE